MTTEEFLDKKNIEVIKEVRDAINIKSQLEATHKFILDLQRNSDMASCPLYRRLEKPMPKVDWSVLQIAMNLTQDYFEGRLVYKEEK